MAFIMLRYVPSIPPSGKILSLMDVEFYEKASSAPIEIIILPSVDMMYHTDWFVAIEPSLC